MLAGIFLFAAICSYAARANAARRDAEREQYRLKSELASVVRESHSAREHNREAQERLREALRKLAREADRLTSLRDPRELIQGLLDLSEDAQTESWRYPPTGEDYDTRYEVSDYRSACGYPVYTAFSDAAFLRARARLRPGDKQHLYRPGNVAGTCARPRQYSRRVTTTCPSRANLQGSISRHPITECL